jgi:hypothetical protein
MTIILVCEREVVDDVTANHERQKILLGTADFNRSSFQPLVAIALIGVVFTTGKPSMLIS